MTDPSGWTPLHAKLHATLRARPLLLPQQRLLVAVSGGQDSLCLAQLCLDLQPKWGWQVGIAHCDHRWRSDSAANAAHVQQLANGWQVSCYVAVAQDDLAGEAAARQWRYQELGAIAQAHRYTHVLTGHTATDRAETLLYNLIRGSGSDGLQALTWQRPLMPGVQVVRPLLELTRSDTGQFCRQAQLPVWQDSTNQDRRYARNRIRHDVMPYLQQHFNPQVEQAMAQTAELLRADVEYLQAAAQTLWQQVSAPDDRGGYRLNRTLLQAAPLALQRRVVRLLLQQALPVAPSFAQIEKAVGLIAAPNRTQTDPFPGGAIARVADHWIELTSPARPSD